MKVFNSFDKHLKLLDARAWSFSSIERKDAGKSFAEIVEWIIISETDDRTIFEANDTLYAAAFGWEQVYQVFATSSNERNRNKGPETLIVAREAEERRNRLSTTRERSNSAASKY